MNPTRLLLGVAATGLGVWFLLAVFGGGGTADAQTATAFTSSNQCRECHAEAFAEWEGSQHAISWTNPAVRMLSNDFSNQDCIDCHAPRPIFVTGIGNRVLPRAARRVEGVDCIACHQLPEEHGGGMAGTLSDPNAACQPTERRELARPDFCAGCHNQHQTIDQWKNSSWAAKGEDCLTCHMPYRDGDPNRGRDHRFLGGNSIELVRTAVELRARREAGALVVELENNGGGHSFPTDERSRRADLFWRVAGETGPDSWSHIYRFRAPYRYEVDMPLTLLEADATYTTELSDVPADQAIEVALFYKRTPYWEDPERPDPEREAQLVHTVEVAP